MALTGVQLQGLYMAKVAAQMAKHPFPGAAAAEAAVESSWFASQSATQHNNLLGIKRPSWWQGDTFTLATKEQRPDGTTYMEPNAVWADFPSWQACFECQMQIFHRHAAYNPVLQCTTAEAYISSVSRIWATGIGRGKMVMSVYLSHLDVLRDPARKIMEVA